MDKKIGVYICTGCDIGSSLDIEALVKAGAPHTVKTHEFLCSEEGTALINGDIEGEGINTVVVAACSMRAMVDSFRLAAPIVERVNLREHVAWSHTPNDEGTQLLAEDYLAMGIVKAQKREPAEPHIEETSKTILVIGGGLTGMTAALEAAAAGYEAVIVEKGDALGGSLLNVWKDTPSRAPYRDLETPQVAEKIKAVEAEGRITVHTGATVEKTAGQPGLFDVTLKKDGGEETIRVGSIVLATGAVPYDASKLGHLGYGASPDVVTGNDLEKMAKNGGVVRPSSGKKPASVTFIQCAGSRDPDHLPYCSAACCANSLKQALYVREQNPDAAVTIIYRDMRTPGNNELFYAAVQEDPGIFLTKGDVTAVSTGGPQVSVTAENTLMGEAIKVESDLVVLATGMVPTTLDDPIVNLQYRQGPALPSLSDYGFPDSHFICFPYETQRTGIYAAGTVRHPMDSAGAVADAAGAALKAIHCVELTSQGKAVHPRVGDETFPEFFLQRCTQCKRCTEECPFGTLDEDEKGTPKPNPFRCRRCGVCMGACPERIISFKDYSVDMIGSMIKKIDVPEDEDIPCIVGLICENDAYPALDFAGINRLQYSANIRFIPLRCAGGTNLVWISDALSRGVDGIMIFGCKHGDNYQCHFIKGSELCSIRLSKVQETLDRIQLEADRVQLFQLSINEYDQLPGLIRNFQDKLEELGPNPFKGF